MYMLRKLQHMQAIWFSVTRNGLRFVMSPVVCGTQFYFQFKSWVCVSTFSLVYSLRRIIRQWFGLQSKSLAEVWHIFHNTCTSARPVLRLSKLYDRICASFLISLVRENFLKIVFISWILPSYPLPGELTTDRRISYQRDKRLVWMQIRFLCFSSVLYTKAGTEHPRRCRSFPAAWLVSVPLFK
jgi:hypothetical protein